MSRQAIAQLEERLAKLKPAADALRGVTSDSRAAGPGKAFVAVRGGTSDGHAFIAQAVAAGAALVVGEDPLAKHAAALGKVPYIQTEDSRLALAYLAAKLAGHPSRTMIVVGVTGTSGKTTSTFLIESILKAAGEEVGVIGTVSFRYGAKVYPSTHTTPGPVELQALLAEMKRDGCTAVVMEVSSHALKQHRATFVAFDAMVFTNLTPEHLDFHPDMEDYYSSKVLLFTDMAQDSIEAGKRPFGAVSIDDEWGQRLAAHLRANPKPEMWFATFGMSPEADISGAKLKIDLAGIRGEAGGVPIRSGLTGRFNVQNILGAVAAAQGLRLDPPEISQGIASLPAVPGRLERVPNKRGIHVLVDYAHKSDALAKVLQTLRDVRGGHRLITVFGCGGDRDRGKRPVMGEMAARLSDHVFVTSDNPRTEDPMAIIEEILGGIPEAARGKGGHVSVELDRKRAIHAAIAMAKQGDLVLIAGKGHEDYQIIGDKTAPRGTRKIHFDDREVAAEALSSK
jgi:UDP-N-acetylmuramoyl-L-alanyl-D-glutamate--2,6-diaminopimelate ligase